MKIQHTISAQSAPRLAVLLAGGLAVCLFVILDFRREPLGVVSAGTSKALTTTYASSNSRPGHMFDVHTQETIRVEDLSCNVNAPPNTQVHYKVYTREGTYEFKTQEAYLWTLQAEGSALSNGQDQPTPLGVDMNLVLPEGQVTGFYVTLASGMLLSTDTPTQYGVVAANSDLSILEGIGITYPFGTIQQRQVWNGTIHYSYVAGAPFCFGDQQGYSCPCGNWTPLQAGCLNGSGRGAMLNSCGNQSLASANLGFTVAGLPPNRPVLLLSGTTKINGGLGAFYGDGLVCIGGSLFQHGVVPSGPLGMARWSETAIAQGSYQSGQTRYFQAIFRDASPGSPCGAHFNLSNGFAVTFMP